MFNSKAELLNGRLAMLGVIAGIGSIVTTGQLIPGIFQMSEFQMALLFPFVPVAAFLIIEFLLEITEPRDDDDDQGGGGIMQPIYVPSNNPA